LSHCFVSYKSTDRDAVAPVVDALRAAQIAVWWDQDLPAGSRWRGEILRQLDAAACVLVCWTEASVGADYVLEEAERAKARGVLLPMRLDPVSPPFGFGELQALDLTGLATAPARDGRWRYVLDVVRARMQGLPVPPPPHRAARWWSVAGVLTLVLSTVGFLNDLGGLKGMVCESAAGRPLCRSLDLPGVPGEQEEALWQAARGQSACEPFRNYLQSYAAGAYAAAAQGRLAARQTTEQHRWLPTIRTQALTVAAETAATEAASRAALQAPLQAEADRLCRAYAQSDVYRLDLARPTPDGVLCAPLDGKVRCRFDGDVKCLLSERHSETVERCGP
jgi:hypothetical protein